MASGKLNSQSASMAEESSPGAALMFRLPVGDSQTEAITGCPRLVLRVD